LACKRWLANCVISSGISSVGSVFSFSHNKSSFITCLSIRIIIQIISGFGFLSHELMVASSFGVFKSSSKQSKQSDKNLIHPSDLSSFIISL
jgi:hypothetical protein